MVRRKKLSKGVRKYIRREKARIRKEVFGIGEQEKLISGVHKKFGHEN